MGFHRIWHGSGQVFDTVDLFLPDVQFPTQVCLNCLAATDPAQHLRTANIIECS